MHTGNLCACAARCDLEYAICIERSARRAERTTMDRENQESMEEIQLRILRVTDDLRIIQSELNCAAMQAPTDPELLEALSAVVADGVAQRAQVGGRPDAAFSLVLHAGRDERFGDGREVPPDAAPSSRRRRRPKWTSNFRAPPMPSCCAISPTAGAASRTRIRLVLRKNACFHVK